MAGITDRGVERLAEGLRRNRSLRYLDLRWYPRAPPACASASSRRQLTWCVCLQQQSELRRCSPPGRGAAEQRDPGRPRSVLQPDSRRRSRAPEQGAGRARLRSESVSPVHRRRRALPAFPLTRTLPLSLSVRSNNIGPEGLLSLARVLKVNSALTDINIWGNQLEEPVSQVTRAFSNFPCEPTPAGLRLCRPSVS